MQFTRVNKLFRAFSNYSCTVCSRTYPVHPVQAAGAFSSLLDDVHDIANAPHAKYS